MASQEDIKGMAEFIVEMMWPQFDIDGNGYLDKNEIDALIKQSQEEAKAKGATVPSYEEMLAEVMKTDTNKDGVISKEEFTNYLIG